MSKPAGVFWKKTKRNTDGPEDEQEFWSGNIDLGILGEVSVVIFPNTRKENDRQPDMNMYISRPKAEKTDETGNVDAQQPSM